MALFMCCAACAKQEFNLGQAGVEADMATCAKLSKKKKFDQAIECLEILKSRYAGNQAASDAELQIGDAFFDDKEYLLAAESYESFLRNYPIHAKADYALYRMGLSYLRETPKAIDRDQVHLEDAIDALKNHQRVFPKSEYADETTKTLQDALAKAGRQQFYVGRFYYRTGEYRAALSRLEEVIQRYPETPKLAQAYHHVIVAYAELHDLENARRVYSTMEAAMPNDRWTRKAARRLGNKTK